MWSEKGAFGRLFHDGDSHPYVHYTTLTPELTGI
jgi:hypothetical protein